MRTSESLRASDRAWGPRPLIGAPAVPLTAYPLPRVPNHAAGARAEVGSWAPGVMADLSWHLWHDGYRAVERDRARRGAGPTYVSRLLGRRAVVLAGEPGARAFYDEDLVRRADAIPPPLAALLFGRGAVHATDDAEHRERKQLFLGVLTPDGVTGCVEDAADRLRAAAGAWGGRDARVHDALVEAYGPAVLAWAGVSLGEAEARRTAHRYAAIVDGFGFAMPAYLRAWRERLRTDRWAHGLVDDVRAGRRDVRPGTALAAVADSDLDGHTAAVELGNLLRPTVAASWLGTYAALAVTELPEWREALAAPDGDRERWAFAQEVRRLAPFVPVLAGRARHDAELGPVAVHADDHLVLDVRGINLDPDRFEDPLAFRPARFLDHDPGPFAMVPQGGGYLTGHRCPGEDLTMRLLVETVRVVAGLDVRRESPAVLDLGRIPARPAEGLRVRAA